MRCLLENVTLPDVLVPNPEIQAQRHNSAFLEWRRGKEEENLQRANCGREPHGKGNCPLLLVVDDEVVVAVTLAEIIRRHGFNTVWFSDPLRALAYVETVPVDLLLSDITMPVLDGIDLAVRVHAMQPCCSVFLFSAVADQPVVRDRLESLNFNVHLECKPLYPERLLSVLGSLLSNVQATVRSEEAELNLDRARSLRGSW